VSQLERRGIVRHPNFEASLDRIAVNYPRVREIVEGAEWALARDPSLAVVVPELGVSIARLSGGQDLPPVTLYFTHNRRFILMLSIRFDDDDM
jgi:hypothetical protein